MPKTAKDLMDEPVFIDAEASIDEVKNKVEGMENTLILTKDGDFIGEIHERSLLKLIIPQEKIDEEKVIGILGISFDKSYVAEKAEDLGEKHQISVSPDTEIGDIAFLMDKEGIRSIPVKKEGEIIGVVHENHIVGEL